MLKKLMSIRPAIKSVQRIMIKRNAMVVMPLMENAMNNKMVKKVVMVIAIIVTLVVCRVGLGKIAKFHRIHIVKEIILQIRRYVTIKDVAEVIGAPTVQKNVKKLAKRDAYKKLVFAMHAL